MYIFTNTTEMATESTGLIMTFGGDVFDAEIPGYTILNVGGRELLSDELKKQSADGMDGAIITGHTTPARELIVQYKLEAGSDAECRFNFDKLNYLLQKNGKNDVPIMFSDEPEVVYYGRFERADSVPYNSNNVVGTFTLYCQRPHKYKAQATMSGTGSITAGDFSYYALKPDEIALTLSANATKITIDNTTTGRHIILNGTYTAGQVLIIKIPENEITLNRQNIMKNLDYVESDFHEFLLSVGDVITCTPSSPMSIKVRGRLL